MNCTETTRTANKSRVPKKSALWRPAVQEGKMRNKNIINCKSIVAGLMIFQLGIFSVSTAFADEKIF